LEQILSYCVQNSPPVFRTLSQINPDHNLFFKSLFISFLRSFLQKTRVHFIFPIRKRILCLVSLILLEWTFLLMQGNPKIN